MYAGASNMLWFEGQASSFCIAQRNIDATREALARNNIRVMFEDVGGETGRRIWVEFEPFHLRVKHLGATEST